MPVALEYLDWSYGWAASKDCLPQRLWELMRRASSLLIVAYFEPASRMSLAEAERRVASLMQKVEALHSAFVYSRWKACNIALDSLEDVIVWAREIYL